MYFSLLTRKHMLGTHRNTKLLAKTIRGKYAFLHETAEMCLAMTPVLCFLASVCPPHARLHGGPSASPCLMPFSGEQRVFLYESPGSTAQLYMPPHAGICQRPVSSLQRLWCCPLFQNTSVQHLATHVMLHMKPRSPTLCEDV